MLRECFLSFADDAANLRQLLLTAIKVRLTVWLAMSIFCFLLPNHNPGNDVLQFDLMLPQASDMSGELLMEEKCFSWSQIWEDEQMRREDAAASASSSSSCLKKELEPKAVNAAIIFLQETIFPFILTPLTRWDAARFLSLAHDPQLRFPASTSTLSDGTCRNDPTTKAADDNNDDESMFTVSEQAHAFLPLYPFLIRLAAWILWRLFSLVPHSFGRRGTPAPPVGKKS